MTKAWVWQLYKLELVAITKGTHLYREQEDDGRQYPREWLSQVPGRQEDDVPQTRQEHHV